MSGTIRAGEAELSERRLRVVTLLDSLRPGGAERLAATVAMSLDRERFEPFVCVSRSLDGPTLHQTVEAAGVPILSLDRTSRAAVWSWRPLIDLLRRRRIDVLHAHMFGSNVWGTMIGRLARVPVIVAHEHSWSFTGEPVRRLLDRHLIGRAADAIVAVSKPDQRRMVEIERIRPDKVHLIPNGIAHLPAPRTDVRRELGISRDAPVIGTLAVLRPEKALTVLLEAAPRLVAEFPDLRILIAGTGPEEQRLLAGIRSAALEQAVTLLGFRSDVAEVLAALDVAVFSSDREGSPLAVLESMAAGKPVVATRVGGVPDLLEDGREGVLVPPREPAALAAAVSRLLRDRGLRDDLGRAARKRQRRDFSIEATVARVERLYLDLTERNGRA
jgi:glycosyltransferase involved in cell wall biosynthesis